MEGKPKGEVENQNQHAGGDENKAIPVSRLLGKHGECANKCEGAEQEKAQIVEQMFTNWYYVIADATYQKIHLTMKDLIEKKPSSDAPAGTSDVPAAGEDPLNQLRNIVPQAK